MLVSHVLELMLLLMIRYISNCCHKCFSTDPFIFSSSSLRFSWFLGLSVLLVEEGNCLLSELCQMGAKLVPPEHMHSTVNSGR